MQPTKVQTYGTMPSVSQVIKRRRVQFAGHCYRSIKEMVSPFILWKPKPIGRRSQKLTYPDVITKDIAISMNELGVAMQDRETWKKLVKSMISTVVEE